MKKFIASLLIGLFCCGCAVNETSTDAAPSSSSSNTTQSQTLEEASERSKDAPSTSIITINAEKAQTTEVNRVLNVTGSFSADTTVNLAPQISGKILKVNARLGSYVKKGEILLEIDPTDILLDIQLKEANLKQQLAVLGMTEAEQKLPPKDELPNVKKAKVNMENNYATYQRKIKEREADLISEQDLDNAETAYKTSKADYENQLFYADRDWANVLTAKSQLAISKQNLVYTKVLSPLDGIVQEQKMYEGDYVQKGTPSLVIVSSSPLLLDVSIPQKYASRFPIGKKVEITTDAVGSKKFEGTITNISPVTDASVRAVPVQATVHNPSAALKPGMFSDIQLVYERNEALLVPQLAVVEYKGISKVFVIKTENGKSIAHEAVVDKGMTLNGWVEIIPQQPDSVVNGDIVAISGAASLENGLEVKIGKQGNSEPPKM